MRECAHRSDAGHPRGETSVRSTCRAIGAFGFTFGASNFAALAGPTATLTATPTDASANGNSSVIIGPTTLRITYATVPSTTVPEPTSIALLATGLVALVPTLRRRR